MANLALALVGRNKQRALRRMYVDQSQPHGYRFRSWLIQLHDKVDELVRYGFGATGDSAWCNALRLLHPTGCGFVHGAHFVDKNVFERKRLA